MNEMKEGDPGPSKKYKPSPVKAGKLTYLFFSTK
jgi:hypothetical protein